MQSDNKYVYQSSNDKNLESQISKRLFNIIVVIYLFIGHSYYISSLKGCNKSEFDCLNNLNLIQEGINNCLISCYYLISCLFFIQMKLCSLLLSIPLAIIYTGLFVLDHEENFLHHGLINITSLYLLTLVSEIVFLFIQFNRFLFKKSLYSLVTIIISLSLFYLTYFIIKHKDEYYCKEWSKGLNGTYIDNDPNVYPCQINFPD